MSRTDPIEQNILGVQSLVGSKTNKTPYSLGTGLEGVEGDLEDELTLRLDDEELLALAAIWEGKYGNYEAKIAIRQEANKTYYLGHQREGTPYPATDGQPISANLIFEAEETFLPAALSKNPDPVVYSDNSPEGNQLADAVKTMLQYHADQLVLRRKIQLMTRNWSMDFLGILKHGWDPIIKDIKTDVRDAKKFVFDPEGYVDPYGDFCGALGERITVTARKLAELFPRFKAFVTVMVDGKMGTDVTYTQWWNDDYTFTTFKGKVLEKNKNPYFAYPSTKTEIDQDGVEQDTEVNPTNHFAISKKPYTFLSVFSFGNQPHDVTGLIEQNIPNQRRISRRTEQIDTNLSNANNSYVFSENNFNQETARQAATGRAKGHPILVPQGGSIGEAIVKLDGGGVDGSFFNELENSKNDLRSIFGVQGITATQQDEDQTARGMILNQSYDNSRIGGGIGDALEQVADNVFNWWVQLYTLFYDEPHTAMVIGQLKASQFVTLDSSMFSKRIVVTVAPDSMKPKDELTIMNQAVTLFQEGALDPKTLLTILNFPDVEQTSENTVLWSVDKTAYLQLNFPELSQQLAQLQAANQQVAQQQQGQPGQAQGGLTPSPSSGSLQSTPLTP